VRLRNRAGDTKSPSPLKGLRAEGVAAPKPAKYAVKPIKFSKKSECCSTGFFAFRGPVAQLLSVPTPATNKHAACKEKAAETLHGQRRKAEQKPGELGREANQTPKNGEFWFF
jgi:hypothetical protein